MIYIFEDFAPNIQEILKEESVAQYADIPIGDVLFPSLSLRMSAWAYKRFSDLMKIKAVPIMDYFRKYYKNIPQPTFVHTDEGLSRWTAVLSLRNNNGSVAFWSGGERFKTVNLELNTCVVYRSSIQHSRWPEYWDQDEPRLVQVFFFNERKSS